MKNKISDFTFNRVRKTDKDTITIHLEKRIPSLGYSAKELSKMFKEFHKINDKPYEKD